jgi:hypothetical protein
MQWQIAEGPSHTFEFPNRRRTRPAALRSEWPARITSCRAGLTRALSRILVMDEVLITIAFTLLMLLIGLTLRLA